MKKGVFVVIILSFILNGCGYEQLKKEAPDVNTIKINKKFKINLPEDHSKGYMWQLTEDYDKKIIEHLNEVWHGNEKGIDFNFKALSVGEVTLSLIKRKYVDTIDNKTFIVRIIQ